MTTIAENVNGAVSGAILTCVAAGVPQSLIVPCRPWNMPDRFGLNAGKAPAIPDPGFPSDNDKWIGLQGWESGNLSTTQLLNADRKGANAGIILGTPAEFQNGQRLAVLAIDVDIDDAALSTEFQRELNTIHRLPLKRQTIQPRALYLVTIPPDAESRKVVWKAFKDGKNAGKVELLSKGQQAVIGGTHHSGNRITWQPGDSYAPAFRTQSLPYSNSFDDVVAMLESVVACIAGYSFTRVDCGCSSSTGDDVDPLSLAPADLTADDVVDLFNRMENPSWVDRDKYKDIMMSSSGTMRGIKGHRGEAITDEASADDYRVADAAARWAERWEGKKEGQCDYQTERHKWLHDWRVNGRVAGWQQLQNHADRLNAGNEFPGEPAPEGYHTGTNSAAGEAGDWAGDDTLHIAVELDRNDPMRSARAFVRNNYREGMGETLHRHSGNFYRWTGNHYRTLADKEIEAGLYRFLERATHNGDPFLPNRSRVGDILAALSAVTLLPGHIRTPAWLRSGDYPPASEMLACANGLLHLPTRQLLPHTPNFFSTIALPYAYQPDAPAPKEWLAFLKSLWGRDRETVDTLQELFGLLLTNDTRHHKVFLLVGPPRCGKGTIGRVLIEMLGRENTCNPTLSSLGQPFGMASLINKPLATISDARLGRSVDPQTVAERLLSVSGEDQQTIPRKYLDDWTGYLPTRFVVMSNELPRLTDASGALASRFIILQMTQSFLGREDHGLTTRLLRELPGILNWALDGLQRLSVRGHFVQPAAAIEAVTELADLASPIKAFLRDRCEVGPGKSVPCEDLFKAWQEWCRSQNRDAVGTLASFGRDLRAAVPGLTTPQRRVDGRRRRRFEGVGLIPYDNNLVALVAG